MRVQVDIGFEQLVKLAKQLPLTQWKKLKTEVEKEQQSKESVSDMETLLLNAPTFTKKQLDEVAKTRKAISQWRTK
ncbi:MAG: hypothetical protein EOO10_20975 [Chitinophagaceae bacterium]|nr:MAG: hypothetical protein EOO10_20975 [Chitinophagaceae bacterium]